MPKGENLNDTLRRKAVAKTNKIIAEKKRGKTYIYL